VEPIDWTGAVCPNAVFYAVFLAEYNIDTDTWRRATVKQMDSVCNYTKTAGRGLIALLIKECCCIGIIAISVVERLP
jgi:hypothetical protein